MFGKSIRLFKLAGFQVSMDLSWLILFFLISWSLASGVFPNYLPDQSTTIYWVLGIIGALGLFGSIVFHEMCHSLVARRFGLPMKGITLFVFGGVAEMADEPPSAKAEFNMAIAGPLSSIVLGFVFLGFAALGRTLQWYRPSILVLNYLGSINIILAVFNLIPAFPLDGGRVLRSILWHFKKDLNWATRIASNAGSIFGIVLIVLGVFSFMTGAFITGIWWVLIGFFLRNVAQMSWQSVLVRKYFEGEKIQKFMNTDVVTVPPQTPVDRFVEDYVYHYHHAMFPVPTDHTLSCVTTRDITNIPRTEWKDHSVGEIAHYCSPENTVHSEDDAMKVLSNMNKTGMSRFLVVGSDGGLAGIVTLKDLMKYLSLKMELGK